MQLFWLIYLFLISSTCFGDVLAHNNNNINNNNNNNNNNNTLQLGCHPVAVVILHE